MLETDGFYDVFVHDAWRLQGLPMLISPALLVTNRNSWSWANVYGHAVSPRSRICRQKSGRAVLVASLGLALLAPFLPLLQVYRIVRLIAARGRLTVHWCGPSPVSRAGTSWAAGELAVSPRTARKRQLGARFVGNLAWRPGKSARKQHGG